MSNLVEQLNLTKEECNQLTKECTNNMRLVIRRVLFGGLSYKKAGELTDRVYTKQAVYYQLKQLYRRKYGVEYKGRGRHPEAKSKKQITAN